MVDSIKQSMNRVDVQRTRANDTEPKLGTKFNDVNKRASLDNANVDTSKVEMSDKVAQLAQQPPIDSGTPEIPAVSGEKNTSTHASINCFLKYQKVYNVML